MIYSCLAMVNTSDHQSCEMTGIKRHSLLETRHLHPKPYKGWWRNDAFVPWVVS
ncbi:hypothetical protein KAU08_07665 [bacterium]|nr:hypothetical protein [bacterium]